MGGKKKFGAFAGVFTPSILTILGVIMYMRLGWVVGNAGLIGTIIIILIAHVIAVTTGLSVSSVATDKKIGAGGIYYVISRSMGVPIGGAIGIALYTGTAFSIALYLIGFAESFNSYLGLGTSINDLRLTGSIALAALTILALISTSVALKTQFFILAAIIVSLVAIFFGTTEFAPKDVALFASTDSVSMEVVFAIFFPAVTGFTAGIAMSGDLKDPKRSIPRGTLLAIGTGLIVYIGLAVFMAFTINSDLLKSDYNVLMKIAAYAPLVVAGIWGATLSSALGGILGGPRILQAMSIDKVTPRIFGKGRGKNSEPVNALILVFIFAEAGILIGELDVIARVVSMFFLTAYGFINISFFLESWANPDFQPTFKVKRWIGLIGFIACFAVMFKLDMIAMFAAFGVVALLYFWLSRRSIDIGTTDVWESVWSKIVTKGLKKLGSQVKTKSTWNPNVLVFSDETSQRSQLLELSKSLSGQAGIVTDFKLSVDNGTSTPSKNEQSFKDDLLDKLGIYGKRIAVEDTYSGIENIASTYGFTGIEPNTVMMTWSKNTTDTAKFTKMTEKLIHLDYNLLYLDFDLITHYGEYKTLDLWWRETDSNNAELMISIARFISQSREWANVHVRILFVNHNNADNSTITTKIQKLADKLRLKAEIKIINNGVEQKSFYRIIELQSAKTDLILVGIPDLQADKQAQFILNTDELFETVGSTLLVKASNDFNKLDLHFVEKETSLQEETTDLPPLPTSEHDSINKAVGKFNTQLSDSLSSLREESFRPISNGYYHFLHDCRENFNTIAGSLNAESSTNKVIKSLQRYILDIEQSSAKFKKERLPELTKRFTTGLTKFIAERKQIVKQTPKRVSFKDSGRKKTINWQRTVSHQFKYKIEPNTEIALKEFGVQSYIILNGLIDGLEEQVIILVEKINKGKEDKTKTIQQFISNVNTLLEQLQFKVSDLETHTETSLNNSERAICINLISECERPSFLNALKIEKDLMKGNASKQIAKSILATPENWNKNQGLIHNQLETGLNLFTSGLSIFLLNEKIKTRLDRIAISPQRANLKLLIEAVEHVTTHIGTDKLENYTNKTIDELTEGVVHIDFRDLIAVDEDKILSIAQNGPPVTTLMNSESFNRFDEVQDEGVETIEAKLEDIQSHILRTTYLAPLQAAVDNLERMFEENAEDLYSASSLAKHILNEPIDATNKEEYKANLVQVQERLTKSTQSTTKMKATFMYDLDVQLHNALMNLHIRTIIDSFEAYSKIGKHIIKTKSQNWFDKQKESVRKNYNGVYDFVLQRKREVDNIKFIEKHSHFLNDIERTNQFVNGLAINSAVEEALPFYYKKLFTGSHLGAVNPKFRAKELGAASQAIQRIDHGVNGSLMILGEAMAGKSYFIESIAASHLKREKIYITPPEQQNFDKSDVTEAIQIALGKTGQAEFLISQLDGKKTLIFDDLEKWWIKAEDGNGAINYITELIEQFGSNHYFILGCNIHSFDIIRKTSSLSKQLLATVLVPPLSKIELKEILITRHRTAVVDLTYMNQTVSKDSKKTDALIGEISTRSHGNVGRALNIWIRSINSTEDEELRIAKPIPTHFPDVDNPKWKTVLYLLTIHGRLKQQHFERMFKDEPWVSETLKELEKAAIISKRSASTYVVTNSARVHVENWLRGIKILN
ncbi:MAG: solute carrier family 12 sodium/potassium/chloride transporter 2 [Flavobacteriaceae bacterium]|jgi:solute carrier family 12 sodium/potassium/chloride transporter 2